MNLATFESLQNILETYETTGVRSIPALGAVSSGAIPSPMREANPGAGPQAQHADPALDRAVLQATMELERAMLRAQVDLGRAFNALRPYKGSNPTHERLHMVLAVIQQAHELCKELEQSAKTDLRDA